MDITNITVGSTYKDRKSGKEGMLVKIDEDAKELSFLDKNDGTPFTVKTTIFKNFWSKVETAEAVPAEADEPVGDTPCGPEESAPVENTVETVENTEAELPTDSVPKKAKKAKKSDTEGSKTVEEFVASLTDEDKEAIRYLYSWRKGFFPDGEPDKDLCKIIELIGE